MFVTVKACKIIETIIAVMPSYLMPQMMKILSRASVVSHNISMIVVAAVHTCLVMSIGKTPSQLPYELC